MAGHQRSTSWPSMAAHPNAIRIDQALQSIISSVVSSSSVETLCDGLRRLGDVYSCINEAICLRSSNQVVVRGKSRLEEEMDKSLELLDLCNAMQESFTDLKMTIQELQTMLNRGDVTAARVKAQAYVRLVNKANKHHPKNVLVNTSSSNEDGEWLVSLLTAARRITVSALKSAVELLSKQMTASNASKWSFISKTSRVVSCEEVQWQALELGLADLGCSVENLFRSLIQTRVSLLNNLSL